MIVDPFTYADPLYRYAIRRAPRDRRIPIASSPSGVGGFVKVLAGFAVWFFLLGFAARALWQVAG